MKKQNNQKKVIMIIIYALAFGFILSLQSIKISTQQTPELVPVPSVGLKAVWLNSEGYNETILVINETITHFTVEMYNSSMLLDITTVSKYVWKNHSYEWGIYDYGWPCWIDVTNLSLLDPVALGPETLTVVDKANITIGLGNFEVWKVNATDGRSYWYETGNGLLIAYMFGSNPADFHYLESTNANFEHEPTTTTVSSSETSTIITTETSYPSVTNSVPETTTSIETTPPSTIPSEETTEYSKTSEQTETTPIPETTTVTTEPIVPETSQPPKYTSETPTCRDILPPEVEITGIENKGIYSDIITIGVTITDESPIVKVEITINNGDIDETDKINIAIDAGVWKGVYDLDTTDFPDETYLVTIMVIDACNNVKTIHLDITIDNGDASGTAPSISPGFDLISVFWALGIISIVIWRWQRRG
ncbi:MAG: hypothetical protein ACFFB2_02715 [Promethearchaeota archaeon]